MTIKNVFPCVRPMLKRDLVQVLTIEDENNQMPWLKKDFERFMGNRRVDNRGIVAEYREQILGFVLYQVFSPRIVLTEASVHQDYRRRGVGASLVDYIIKEAKSCGCSRICYYITEENLSGQLFLRSCEFLAKKIHRGYYEDLPGDVYEMRMEVSQENFLVTGLARNIV